MPLFEFYCNNCERRFELLCQGFDSKEVDCPNCGAASKKVFSTFRSGKGAGGVSTLSSGGCGG